MRNQTKFVFGGALAALALAGCNNSQPPPAQTTTTVNTTPPVSTTTVTTAPAGTPGGPDTKINNNAGPGSSNGTDQATADSINTAIVHNKEMTGSRVDAVVTGGVARLTGTVQNDQQKALAAAAASKTPGVASVVNKLMIDATRGIHSAPAAPTVIHHTTIINHYIPVPTNNNGNGAMSNGNGMDNGGNGATGNNAPDNGTATTPPAAPTPDNGANGAGGGNGAAGGGQ